MRKITEKQQLIQNKPVIILMLALVLPILIMMGVNIAEAEHLVDEDSLAMGLTALIMILTFFFIFRMTTLLELSSKGLRYKSMPLSRSLTMLPKNKIISVSMESHKWWRGYGYRYSFSGTQIFAMKPGKVLRVETEAGKTLIFGINRPSKVMRFINEEWPNIEVHVE